MFFRVCIFITLVVIYQAADYHPTSISSEMSCALTYGDRELHEGEEITIRGKLYKVENCQIQRAYRTCGPHLWFMINIVCDALESKRTQANTGGDRHRRFDEEKLLTEACCDKSCTVDEMTRYCPQ